MAYNDIQDCFCFCFLWIHHKFLMSTMTSKGGLATSKALVLKNNSAKIIATNIEDRRASQKHVLLHLVRKNMCNLWLQCWMKINRLASIYWTQNWLGYMILSHKRTNSEAEQWEIIRFSWWTSNMVYHSTKRFPLV